MVSRLMIFSGSNHGMAWVDSTFSGNFGTVLYLCDNTYGQVTHPEIPDSARISNGSRREHNIIYVANIIFFHGPGKWKLVTLRS